MQAQIFLVLSYYTQLQLQNSPWSKHSIFQTPKPKVCKTVFMFESWSLQTQAEINLMTSQEPQEIYKCLHRLSCTIGKLAPGTFNICDFSEIQIDLVFRKSQPSQSELRQD